MTKAFFYLTILLFPTIMFFLIFKSWFLPYLITGGDFWPTYKENYLDFSFLPQAWNLELGNGLGGNSTIILWAHFFHSLPFVILGQLFSFDYLWLARLGFLFPLVFALFFISFFGTGTFFKSKSIRIVSTLIYTFNTYVLMIIGGGQIGVGLAYGIAPLVLGQMISLIELLAPKEQNKVKAQRSLFCRQAEKLKTASKNLKLYQSVVFVGLTLAIQMMFDLRIAYVTLMACGLYALVSYLLYRFNLIKFFILCCLFFGLTLALHAFWILPTVLAGATGIENIGKAYTSVEAVKFFSFADFAHSFSLLHPNWPENIFGKIYFLESSFLLIPILAYTSLLFVKNSKFQKQSSQIVILYFALLGLLGIFLAKGAKAPFGEIYLWLFQYMPGFIMFRDPTKFYVLIAIAYSILIPSTLKELSLWLRTKKLLL